jgi:hypothetical protein
VNVIKIITDTSWYLKLVHNLLPDTVTVYAVSQQMHCSNSLLVYYNFRSCRILINYQNSAFVGLLCVEKQKIHGIKVKKLIKVVVQQTIHNIVCFLLGDSPASVV